MQGNCKAWHKGVANKKPRLSIPAMRVAFVFFAMFASHSMISVNKGGSCRSGVMSRKTTPFLGKLGTSKMLAFTRCEICVMAVSKGKCRKFCYAAAYWLGCDFAILLSNVVKHSRSLHNCLLY